MPELEKMTLADLKSLAKENNIKNISKLKKEDLIEILEQILKKLIKLQKNTKKIKNREDFWKKSRII